MYSSLEMLRYCSYLFHSTFLQVCHYTDRRQCCDLRTSGILHCLYMVISYNYLSFWTMIAIRIELCMIVLILNLISLPKSILDFITHCEGKSCISQNSPNAVSALLGVFPVVVAMIRAIFNAPVVKYPSRSIVHIWIFGKLKHILYDQLLFHFPIFSIWFSV